MACFTRGDEPSTAREINIDERVDRLASKHGARYIMAYYGFKRKFRAVRAPQDDLVRVYARIVSQLIDRDLRTKCPSRNRAIFAMQMHAT